MHDKALNHITYSVVSSGFIERGVEKKYLGSKNNRVCRFCGKTENETPFKNKAHAFPQFIGNTKLLSYYECDCCNIFFTKLEDNFAKYFKTLNTLTGVKGNKNNIPTYKSKDGATRIEAKNQNEVHIHTDKGSDVFTIEKKDNGCIINIKYGYQPFIPIAVFKCLVKMSLTIMPEEELCKFTETISWLMSGEHKNFYGNNRKLMLKFALLKNRLLDSKVVYGLYKNESPRSIASHMLFYVSWGQMYCLIEIPHDKNNDCIEIVDIPPIFPNIIITSSIEHIDLSSGVLIGKNEATTK